MSSKVKYCETCDNILYPSEDKDDKENQKLFLKCKICDYKLEVKSDLKTDLCVYSSSIRANSMNMDEYKDMVDDPSLSRQIMDCPNCMRLGEGPQECVFF